MVIGYRRNRPLDPAPPDPPDQFPLRLARILSGSVLKLLPVPMPHGTLCLMHASARVLSAAWTSGAPVLVATCRLTLLKLLDQLAAPLARSLLRRGRQVREVAEGLVFDRAVFAVGASQEVCFRDAVFVVVAT